MVELHNVDFVGNTIDATQAWDLTLDAGSSLIDAGDPSILDADGTTSDIGAYGGPDGNGW